MPSEEFDEFAGLPNRNKESAVRMMHQESLPNHYKRCLPHRSFARPMRSEEHTSELQSLMRISYAVFCLKKKKTIIIISHNHGTQNQQDQRKSSQRDKQTSLTTSTKHDQ